MKQSKKWSKITFIIAGLGSILWFLVRVIPKPSRAAYPCIKASYPIMSSFVVYMIGAFTSIFFFKKSKTQLARAKYLSFAVFLVAGLLTTVITLQHNSTPSYAYTTNVDIPNQVMGIGRGYFPGRVTWAHDPDATRDRCSLGSGDGWFLSKNTDIDVVENMMTRSVFALTDKNTVQEAWDALFVYFNRNKGKGDISYQAGESIFIKCNFVGTNGCNSNYEVGGGSYKTVRTSPQTILVTLRHLVNHAGVAQENISFGDPMQCVIKEYYEIISAEFPNVNYIDKFGRRGRTKAETGLQDDIFYSDRGTILRTGGTNWSDPSDSGPYIEKDVLYRVIEEADYMINIAALKAHHRAGVTLTAKNHFGSHTRETAMHLHMGLAIPDGRPGRPTRPDYKMYRIQVDLMGHEMLGGNTMLFIVDGLWGGPDAGAAPTKWRTEPFNRDWTSSIFMSIDQVALESVCFDFLKAEYVPGRSTPAHPHMDAADDYLRQAADPTNWPEGFEYDPEKDGTALTSLGVHEHWNNATDKQYSRNLGEDRGIELYTVNMQETGVDDKVAMPQNFVLLGNYPNPFNPGTNIHFQLSTAAETRINIYDINGRLVDDMTPGTLSKGYHSIHWDAGDFPAGAYMIHLVASEGSAVQKCMLLK